MNPRPIGYPPNLPPHASGGSAHVMPPRPVGYPPNVPHAAGPPGPPIQPPHAADPPPPTPVVVAVEQGKVVRSY